jgi:hypothetical protein
MGVKNLKNNKKAADRGAALAEVVVGQSAIELSSRSFI